MENFLSHVSTSNHVLNLDNLPIEVYHFYLFSYLDIDDILDLRLISKNFYRIIKSYDIKELSFFRDDLIPIYSIDRKNWFTTTKSTKHKSRLAISKLFLLKKPSKNLLNLKYLTIKDFDHLLIKLEDLNKFTKLQILDLEEVDSCSNSFLRLPDLKALSMNINSRGFGNLLIDTPNLHSLSICHRNKDLKIMDIIKFEHPLSIRYLQVSNYDNKLSIFKNLELLELFKFYNYSNLRMDDLLQFKNLKKLKIVAELLKVDKLKELFKSKNNLEIVLDGVKIKEISKFDDYKKGKHNNHCDFKFQINNYDDLEDNLEFVTYVNYNDLIRLLSNKQPSDLFNKYTNIQKIKIKSKVENEKSLINFINNCFNLNYLITCESSLSQEFYDLLPEISSLFCLTIESEDIKLNFEFVSKISYLTFFYADQDVLIDSNINFNNLKYLKQFQFQIENYKIALHKNGNSYSVYTGGFFGTTKCFTLKEFIEWTNDLRLKEQT